MAQITSRKAASVVRQQGGRWDVGAKNNAVYLERISESDEQLFDDLLAPEEARELAGLLTKFADRLDEAKDSEDSDKGEGSDEDEGAESPDDSEDSEDSDKASD